MKHTFAVTLIAAAFVASGGALAQNINQSQSGNSNNQSISIGNVDGKPAKKPAKSKKSVQKDDSGNTQSSDVAGGTGDINQSQKGNNNKQSMSIGGNVTSNGKLPTVTQSQQGSGRDQSIVVDGNKVEKKSN